MGKGTKDEATEPPVGKRILIMPFNLPPGRLHEETKFNARGAGRLAVAAEEAEVHMLDEVVGDSNLSL